MISFHRSRKCAASARVRRLLSSGACAPDRNSTTPTRPGPATVTGALMIFMAMSDAANRCADETAATIQPAGRRTKARISTGTLAGARLSNDIPATRVMRLTRARRSSAASRLSCLPHVSARSKFRGFAGRRDRRSSSCCSQGSEPRAQTPKTRHDCEESRDDQWRDL